MPHARGDRVAPITLRRPSRAVPDHEASTMSPVTHRRHRPFGRRAVSNQQVALSAASLHRRLCRRSPARRGSADDGRRSRHPLCRGRRRRRSARSGRPTSGAGCDPGAGPPPAGCRTRPDTCTATPASGRSSEKLATLETTSVSSSPDRNCSKSTSRSDTGVSPVTTGASRLTAQLRQLIEVLPDHQHPFADVPAQQRRHHRQLQRVLAASRYRSSGSAMA